MCPRTTPASCREAVLLKGNANVCKHSPCHGALRRALLSPVQEGLCRRKVRRCRGEPRLFSQQEGWTRPQVCFLLLLPRFSHPPSLPQRMGQSTLDTHPLGASTGGDMQLELETLQQHLQVLLLVSEAPGCLKTLPLQQEAPVLRHSQTGRVRCTTQLSQGGQQSPRAALCACRGT